MAKGGKLSDEILSDLAKSRGGGGGAADDEDAADGGADEAAEGEDAYQGDEETIAGELKQALDGGDSAEIAKALRSFLDVCVPKIVQGEKGASP